MISDLQQDDYMREANKQTNLQQSNVRWKATQEFNPVSLSLSRPVLHMKRQKSPQRQSLFRQTHILLIKPHRHFSWV